MKVAEGKYFGCYGGVSWNHGRPFPLILYASRENIQIEVKDLEPQKNRATGHFYQTELVRREKENVISGIRNDNSVISNRFVNKKSTSTVRPSTSFTGNEFEQGQIWG